jgi:murein DD-endopeptidase MepM/ murein hydrolase activator NlpD
MESNPYPPIAAARGLDCVRNLRQLTHGVAIATALVVGLIAVSTAAPASGRPTFAASAVQSLAVSSSVPEAAISRDAYRVTSPPALVWPVGASSPIASSFGPRVAPCGGCSSRHEGVDFDAGSGAQIHAIAAGVVVEADGSDSAALGVHVAIRHVIGAQTIVSVYGHLRAGSMSLRTGDTVYAGQVVGLVGSTGESTGPHLHFEIRLSGTTPIDPLPWMCSHLG